MYLDSLEQSIDNRYLIKSTDKIKQSLRHEIDQNAIDTQINDFIEYAEAKSIIRQMREEMKHGQTASIDTGNAKQKIDELKKLIDGLGK